MTWTRAPIALFLIAALAIGGVTAAAVVMRGAVRDSDAALEVAAIELAETERLRGLRDRVSRKARSFLFAGDDRFILELRQAENAFEELLSTMHTRAEKGEERQLTARLHELERARRSVSNRLIEGRNAGSPSGALVQISEAELQPLVDELDATLIALVDDHHSKLIRARDRSKQVFASAALALWIAASLALGVAGLSSVALARTLRRMHGRGERTRRHLAAIVQSSDDAVFSKDLDGRIASWNESAERIFGYAPQEIIGREVSVLAAGDLAGDIPGLLARIREGQRIPHLEALLRAKDGRLVNVVLTISPIRDEAGDVVSASTIARDVTQEQQLRRDRDRWFELSPDMVCVAGTDGYFKQLNPAFETTLGFERAELRAKPFIEFVHVEDRDATLKQIERLSLGEASVDFENRYQCKDGTYRWLSWHASPEPPGVIYAVARDVSQRKLDEQRLATLTEELRVMAVVDQLTGLNNRRGFSMLAGQQLRHAQRSREKSILFFADLDGLKRINDSLGHAAGDHAIRDAAALLTSTFRKSDILARLGGDEFVVLATNNGDGAALIERLQDQIQQYNQAHPPRPFTLGMSVGSTLCDPDHPETIDAVLKRADEMMYKQKARRRAETAALAS